MEGNLMENRNALLTGRIGPVLLKFAMPFMMASFLQALYGAVDLFVVGQYSGSAAVAAVSIGSQVMMTVTSILIGISTGGTVLIAHRIGEQSDRKAAQAVGTLTVLFGILAAVLTPLMLLCTNAAVSLMSTPEEAVADAQVYIRICSAGVPFIIGYNGVSAIFRGIGDSKTPVLFIIIATIVNIAGDFLCVGVMGMGAAGAAIATTAAQAISFGASVLYIGKKGLSFPFSMKDIRLDRQDTVSILTVGLPLALQDSLVHISFLMITAIINSLGLVASAAVGIAEKIMGFAFLPAGAFSSAVATMSAQNLGAGDPDRAKHSWLYGMGYSFLFGALVCLFAQLFPNVLPAVFSKDAAVITAAGQYMRTYAIDCVLVSFVFNTNSYFSSYGKSMICFAHSMAATFLFRIPATYLFSKIAGDSLLPMGWAAPLASLCSIVICLVFLPKLNKSTYQA